jgi:hypothetical protein
LIKYLLKSIKKIYRLCSDFLFKKILLPYRAKFGRELSPNKWVFIIGCYNSGTTLLSRILSQHDKISSMPDEGVFYTDVLRAPEEFGWSRLWIKCLNQMNEIFSKKESQYLSDRIKKQWSYMYENADAPILLEKSISNITRLKFLDEYFKPAYFIYLVRDGYAVSEGICRKAKPYKWGNMSYPKGYNLDMCSKQWVETDAKFEEQFKGLNNVLIVKYESLTKDPVNTLESITNFIGVTQLPEELLSSDWSIHEKNEIIQNMNHKSYNNLTNDDIAIIEKQAKNVLIKYGYFPLK